MQSSVWSYDQKGRLDSLQSGTHEAFMVFLPHFEVVCMVGRLKLRLRVDLDLFSLLFQHHCRACGQIFCGKCSSKYSTIPKFGIEKEVRVCEPCFEQLNK